MKQVRQALTSLILLVLATSSCKPVVDKVAQNDTPQSEDAEGEESSTSAVFKQTSRRIMNASEAWGMGALYRGSNTNRSPDCAVFFLDSPQNTATESIVATQRHCVQPLASEMTPETWCNPNGAQGGYIKDWETGNVGQCTSIEMLFSDRDLFIFRARINRNTSRVMQLGDFVPSINTRVAQMGFPSDLQNSPNGDLILTRNCWVLSIDPVFNADVNESYRREHGQFAGGPKARYNCTTVQGNSGGPAVIDTYPFTGNPQLPVVIGLPVDGSDPWNRPSDPEVGTPVTHIKGFVDENRAKFNELGIRLATTQSTLGNQSRAMHAGRYTSPQYPNYNFDILPYYYNGTDPREIRVTFVPVASGATNMNTYFLQCTKQPPYIMVCSHTNDRNVTLTFNFDAAASFLMEMSTSPGAQYRFDVIPNGSSRG